MNETTGNANEHRGRECTVTGCAEEADDGTWRGSALIAHPTRLDVEERWHEFDTRHATRAEALDEVRRWAVERYPA